MGKITLKARVLEYLQEHKTLTTKECVNVIGTTELRKIVSDLRRDGNHIVGVDVTDKNRYGDKVQYKRYTLL